MRRVTDRRMLCWRAWLLPVLLITATFLSLPPAARAESPTAATTPSGAVVRAILFWSETCPHCHEVITESLPPIQERYGAQLEVLGANISQEAGYRVWSAVMDGRGIAGDQQVVPMLIVGDEVLTGSVDIPEQLPGIVDRLLAAGGADLPEDIGQLVAAAQASAATPAPTPTARLLASRQRIAQSQNSAARLRGIA